MNTPKVECVSAQKRHLAEEERPTRAETDAIERARPRVRGDCIDGPRPCPWYGCRYHLGLDVSRKHEIQIIIDPESIDTTTAPTCALDLADDHEFVLEAIADILGLTRERIRQIEDKALGHANINSHGIVSREDA